MEKSFAKKTHRKIETLPDREKKAAKGRKSREAEEQTQEEIEKPPEDSDDEIEDDSDVNNEDDEDEEDTEEGKKTKNAKKQAALLAEQSLCELTSKIIFAVVGGAIKDDKLVKDHLLLNRSKLGKNYSVLVGYIEEKKKKAPAKAKGGKKSEKKGEKKGQECCV